MESFQLHVFLNSCSKKWRKSQKSANAVLKELLLPPRPCTKKPSPISLLTIDDCTATCVNAEMINASLKIRDIRLYLGELCSC